MIPPPPPYTVIVCGGRDYANRDSVFTVLDSIHNCTRIDLLIHGGAKGADTLAGDWAHSRSVRLIVFAADWHKHGRAAGPMRNQKMAETGANLLVAFSGGAGTADMVRKATAAGIMVESYA